MNRVNLYENAVSRLAAHSDTIGRLAQDNGGFSAIVAAFESKDAEAFRWVLERLGFLPQCDLICEWVRVKLCVLRCIEVCGVPREKGQTPDFERFAHAVVKLASHEKQLRRAVDAVSCGDGSEYRAAIGELELQEFCHLLCYWICSVVYGSVCEVVCSPDRVRLPDAVNQIRRAGEVMARVISNERTLGAISNSAIGLNCVTLQSTLDEAGLLNECEIICAIVCTWRCVLVCGELCDFRQPILTAADAVEEARSFALASRQLANQPRALGDLVSAVAGRDAKTYSEIVSRFGLEPYCQQVCAWVCAVVCYEFCICVCPNEAQHPWFTTVGSFDIYSDIGASGKTNKAVPLDGGSPGGGPNYAFFDCLQLGGFCPAFSPTSPGTPMQYRFLFSNVSTTLTAAISAFQTTVSVASSANAPATPFNIAVGSAGATGETMTVTGIAGTTWTVTRGQEGSTAISATAGAKVWINPAPIKDNLVCQVEAGSRTINWPQNIGGLASASLAETFQTVIVASAPTPPDPTPPAPGTPWVGPSAHYIQPDPNGWVAVDPNAIGGGFQVLMGFDTTQPPAAPGGDPLPDPVGTPGGTPAGSPVPAVNQKVGTDMAIIFQATRTTVSTVDYSNSLNEIHVNNWSEVNNLWFLEFTTGGAGCCTPIADTLSVQFTVDHEELDSNWSLVISSCATIPPPGGNITPSVTTASTTTTALSSAISSSQTSINVLSSAGFPSTPFIVTVGSEIIAVTGVSGTTWTVERGTEGTTAAAASAGATVTNNAGVTLDPIRGGWGTIVKDTSTWTDCSYTVTLFTTPLLTTGLLDRPTTPNPLTFCICGQ